MFEINEIVEISNQVNLSSLYEIAKNSAQIGNEILKINYLLNAIFIEITNQELGFGY